MHDRPVAPRASSRRGNLQHTARVGGGVDVRRERREMRRLAVSERARRVGLHEVVDAGAAAADVRFCRRGHFEPGDRRQQLSWLGVHALCVAQVTGVMVRDPRMDRVPPRARLAKLHQDPEVAEYLPLAFGKLCMHEFVLSGAPMKKVQIAL